MAKSFRQGLFSGKRSEFDPSSSESHRFSTEIDFASEPQYYYHSVGGMNPMKLKGILEHGILSKSEAEKRGLVIDANGLQCNGLEYISTATYFGGYVTIGRGAFHFVIDREKLTNPIQKNPIMDMPHERQVYSHIPRTAIKGIQLEKEGFIDIEHPSIKLKIGEHAARAAQQTSTYTLFMIEEFGYKLPDEEVVLIQKAIQKMEAVSSSGKSYNEKQSESLQLEANIEAILKKNLKRCYKKLIKQDSITPYDILRHYAPKITVYDHTGKKLERVIDNSFFKFNVYQPSFNPEVLPLDRTAADPYGPGAVVLYQKL